MREIKFRAWHKTKQCMIYSGEVILYLDSMICEMDNAGDFHATTKYELMQYTGLKDKNGKEIYEGDIVACAVEWMNKESHKILEVNVFRGKVCFVNSQWVITGYTYSNKGEILGKEYIELRHLSIFSWGGGILNYNGRFEAETRYREFEVIGNIYENPELLKETK